jgi:PEP-CTERM motif
MNKRHVAIRWAQFAALACAAVTGHAANNTLTEGAPPTLISDPAGSGRTTSLYYVDSSYSLVYQNGGLSMDGLLPSGNKPLAVGGALATFNMLKAVSTTLDGAAQTETKARLANGRTYRTWMEVNGAAPSLGLEAQTGVPDTADGGVLQISSLSGDPRTGGVYADISYRKQAVVLNDEGGLVSSELGPWVTANRVHLWDAASVSGATLLSPKAALAAADGDGSLAQAEGWTSSLLVSRKIIGRVDTQPVVYGNSTYGYYYYYPYTPIYDGTDVFALKGDITFDKLMLTPEGFDILRAAWGLEEGSIGYDEVNGINQKNGSWGSFKASMTVVPLDALANPDRDIYQIWASIPEPSTYALMGLGLVGVALATRQRRRHAA